MIIYESELSVENIWNLSAFKELRAWRLVRNAHENDNVPPGDATPPVALLGSLIDLFPMKLACGGAR
jgi:hypothetical protein